MIRSAFVTLKAESRKEELLARIGELEAALAREERITAALREVGAAVGSTVDLDQLLELILERTTDLVDADRATLYLLDESTQELVSRIAVGDEIRSVRLKVGHGIAGMVARTGRTIRVRDAYRDKRFVRDWDELLGYRTQSMLAAPLKNHLGKIIGVVQVVNKKGRREFTTQDEALLVALATQAAISIDHSRLFLSVTQKNMQLLDTKEKLEQSVLHLRLLFELESTMNRASTLEDLVREALRKTVLRSDAAAGSVLLVDEDAGAVELFVWNREHPEVVHRETVGAGSLPGAPCTSVLSRAMQEARPVSVRLREGWSSCTASHSNGAAAKPSGAAGQDDLGRKSGVAAIAVPLDGEDAPMGALGLCGRKGSTYTNSDTELLRLVAANFSTAVRLFRSRLRREREERLSTIGSLLSSVFHDLKGPIAVIHGCVAMMAPEQDAAERERYAKMVAAQLALIGTMQREVLEFARGERRALVRKVYLAPFFEELAAQLGREVSASASRIELELQLEDRGTAQFDQAKITRVIQNLVRNAMEAMGLTGGKISLRVRRESERKPADGPLIIEVADTGPGIPKEIEGRLFQSFVTAGKKGGTGLGLAIVKKIVEEHDGSVSVQSSGTGTVFTVVLPQPPRPSV